jgi:hypothetical protein
MAPPLGVSLTVFQMTTASQESAVRACALSTAPLLMP